MITNSGHKSGNHVGLRDGFSILTEVVRSILDALNQIGHGLIGQKLHGVQGSPKANLLHSIIGGILILEICLEFLIISGSAHNMPIRRRNMGLKIFLSRRPRGMADPGVINNRTKAIITCTAFKSLHILHKGDCIEVGQIWQVSLGMKVNGGRGLRCSTSSMLLTRGIANGMLRPRICTSASHRSK
jgi:hypothetical protein